MKFKPGDVVINCGDAWWRTEQETMIYKVLGPATQLRGFSGKLLVGDYPDMIDEWPEDGFRLLTQEEKLELL